MHITPWKSFGDFDHPFERMPHPFAGFAQETAVDLYEEDGIAVVRMTLPGVEPKELEVTLEENLLTVSGRREEEQESERKDYYTKEIRRGSFSRAITLPRAARGNEATAAYRDGVLTVTVPLAADAAKAVAVPVTR